MEAAWSVGSDAMDSEYREPSWRGVLVTLAAIVLVLAGLILLTSYFLQQSCVPGATQAGVTECAAPTGEPDPGSE